MKKSKKPDLIFAFALLTWLTSCHKLPIAPISNTHNTAGHGIYILNTGNPRISNADGILTYYNFASKAIVPNQYGVANGTQLGFSGYDIEIYGSKMYIVSTSSNVVDIVDRKTSKLIKQVSFVTSNYVNAAPLHMPGKQPKSIAFYNGNAFVSCNDGTVAVMDTTTLAITKNIPLGTYGFPQGLVVANGKLYVAAPGYEGNVTNTVFTINLTTLTVIKTIAVIPKPESLATDAYGNVYVMSGGNFDDGLISLGGLTVIDSQADTVKSKIPASPGDTEPGGTAIPITVLGDFVYYLRGQSNKIAVYNAKTQTLVSTSFITDGTLLTLPTAIAANPLTGEIYITDAKDFVTTGSLYAFDKAGKLEYTLTTGIDPVGIAMLQ
jgi:hypothetical protein